MYNIDITDTFTRSQITIGRVETCGHSIIHLLEKFPAAAGDVGVEVGFFGLEFGLNFRIFVDPLFVFLNLNQKDLLGRR